jgi:hypothetical protein
LVVLACARAVAVEVQLRLVDLRSDHCDVHEEQDLLQGRLLHIEGGTALEGHHLLVCLLLPLQLGLGELDADVDRVEGEDVGLEDEEVRSFDVGNDGGIVELDADVVLLR